MAAGSTAIGGLRCHTPSPASISWTIPAARDRCGAGRSPRVIPTSSGPVTAQVRTADEAAQNFATGVTGDPGCTQPGHTNPTRANTADAEAPTALATNRTPRIWWLFKVPESRTRRA